MGTPEFAVASLDILVQNNYEIVGVVTVPDKPAGRGQQLQQSAVKKYALEKGFIETDTLLFNNLVDTKEKLENEWLVPLNKSWLWNRIVN